MQLIFLFLIVTIFPLLVPFLIKFDELVQQRKRENPEYPWPEYEDFWITILSAALLHLGHKITFIITDSFYQKNIDPKYQGEERAQRIKRSKNQLFKGFYFAFAISMAWYAAKDSEFLPPALGGKGYVWKAFDGFPYQDQSAYPLVRTSILIQLGYHFYSFLDHLGQPPRHDFVELLLHHSITVFLTSLAYFMNYVTISHLFLFVHDVGDLFLAFGRAFADTVFKKIPIVAYIILLLSWPYYRLYLYWTSMLWASCYANPKIDEIYGIEILGFMAHVLLLLHIYWYFLMLSLAKSILYKGQTDDKHHFHESKKNS